MHSRLASKLILVILVLMPKIKKISLLFVYAG
uniref:Uncharacterized protein n=1 Tax=Rhizophora mucronata TaxID=61149 RepID=A0A2P2N6G3_RHIMU